MLSPEVLGLILVGVTALMAVCAYRVGKTEGWYDGFGAAQDKYIEEMEQFQKVRQEHQEKRAIINEYLNTLVQLTDERGKGG